MMNMINTLTNFFSFFRKRLTIGNAISLIITFILSIFMAQLYLRVLGSFPTRGGLDLADLGYLSVVVTTKFIVNTILEFSLGEKFSMPLLQMVNGNSDSYTGEGPSKGNVGKATGENIGSKPAKQGAGALLETFWEEIEALSKRIKDAGVSSKSPSENESGSTSSISEDESDGSKNISEEIKALKNQVNDLSANSKSISEQIEALDKQREENRKYGMHIKEAHKMSDKMSNVLSEQRENISKLRDLKFENKIDYFEVDGSLEIGVPLNMNDAKINELSKKVAAIDRGLNNKFAEFRNLSSKSDKLNISQHKLMATHKESSKNIEKSYKDLFEK